MPDDLRRLARDIAAAVHRGDDTLPLLRIATAAAEARAARLEGLLREAAGWMRDALETVDAAEEIAGGRAFRRLQARIDAALKETPHADA